MKLAIKQVNEPPFKLQLDIGRWNLSGVSIEGISLCLQCPMVKGLGASFIIKNRVELDNISNKILVLEMEGKL